MVLTFQYHNHESKEKQHEITYYTYNQCQTANIKSTEILVSENEHHNIHVLTYKIFISFLKVINFLKIETKLYKSQQKTHISQKLSFLPFTLLRKEKKIKKLRKTNIAIAKSQDILKVL